MEDLKDCEEMRNDAKRTMWAFLLLNIGAILFWLIGSPLDEVAWLFFFLQVFFLIIWLLPYFLYQTVFLKRNFKYAFFRALSSYKDLFAHFNY
jgi:hypothetical protein